MLPNANHKTNWRMNVKIFKFSLLKLLRTWQLYLFFLFGLLIFTFIAIILPIIANIGIINFYSSGPDWLSIVWPASLIIVCIVTSLISEINANKKQMIYIISKNVRRFWYLWSKFLSTLVVTILFTLMIFSEFYIIDLISRTQPGKTLFTTSISWYGILISLLIVCVFASSTTICCHNTVTGVWTIIDTIIVLASSLIFPILWNINGYREPDQHRIWYTLYMSLVFYLPMAIFIFIANTLFFCNKKIKI
jgi:hypothetical protein